MLQLLYCLLFYILYNIHTHTYPISCKMTIICNHIYATFSWSINESNIIINYSPLRSRREYQLWVIEFIKVRRTWHVARVSLQFWRLLERKSHRKKFRLKLYPHSNLNTVQLRFRYTSHEETISFQWLHQKQLLQPLILPEPITNRTEYNFRKQISNLQRVMYNWRTYSIFHIEHSN